MHVFLISYCSEPIYVVNYTDLWSVIEHSLWTEMCFFSVGKLAMLCLPFVNVARLMKNHWTKLKTIIKIIAANRPRTSQSCFLIDSWLWSVVEHVVWIEMWFPRLIAVYTVYIIWTSQLKQITQLQVISRPVQTQAFAQGGGRGVDSHIKRDEMLVGNFEKNPWKRPIWAWLNLF